MKLGEYVKFQNGYAFKSKDFVEIGKYKVIKIKEIKDGVVKFFSDTTSIDCEMRDDFDKYLVFKGDVLFALTGDPVNKPNPLSWVGRVAIYLHEEPALLNQRVCKLLPNKDVNAKYIYYYFRQFEHFYDLASKATGSASQANISTKLIESVDIDLPERIIQDKIVEWLDSISEKIEINKKINDNLYAQARAITKEWISENTGDYELSFLSDIALINPETYSPKEEWKYVNYLDTSSITHGCITEIQRITTSSEKLPSRARRKIAPNDIVFSTVRPNQRHFGIISEPLPNMLGSTGFAVIRSKNPLVCNELIYLCLTENEFIEKMQQLAEQSTSTFPSIKPSDLGVCKIPCPKDDSSKYFTETLKSMFAFIAVNQQESTYLADMRDALLPKLMSGEIDVSAIQI